MLDRNSILSIRGKLRRETVKTDHGEVLVREMTAREKDEIDLIWTNIGVKGADMVRSRIALFGIIDENGANVFSESDLILVATLPASFIIPVADKVNELSGNKRETRDDIKSAVGEVSGDAIPSPTLSESGEIARGT